MRYDVVVVGGGTAGCVLAARLSEKPDRSVCLVEAGPDYGASEGGRWPAELLDFRSLPSTHGWGPGGEDGRSLGGRVLGGSSTVNACVVVRGTPSDYDEWGEGWAYATFRPYLDRAQKMLRAAPLNTDRPGPFHTAFVEAARRTGFPLLAGADDPDRPVGVAPFPANVAGGTRWNAAFAYLDPARGRPTLEIRGETLIDRLALSGSRCSGVVDAHGTPVQAETVILAAGAYFSPAILLRSGIGPAPALRSLGIPVCAALPVGERLLDHCGTSVAWEPAPALARVALRQTDAGGLVEPHAVVKAASSSCPQGAWDLHLLSWIYPADEPGTFEASAIVFHMKPVSHGRVSLRSRDPREAPLVERGFLSRSEDLPVVLEGIELGRTLAATEPLAGLLEREIRPGSLAPERYVRDTIRNYFHPAGTCAMGSVVDREGRVLGVDGLIVADASIMPTIPRANTNLTTAAIAERIAETL